MNMEMPSSHYNSSEEEWDFSLYVVNRTPRCVLAYQNLERICDKYLHNNFKIKLIDIQKNPSAARKDQIVAVPTLIIKTSERRQIMVGDFSRTESILKSLNIDTVN